MTEHGEIDSHVRFDGPFTPLADDERNASLKQFLDGMPPGDPWIFAYGSLMWDRDVFSYEEAASALVHGFHRRFCIWTVLARGTPELPGLSVGLEPGGSCRGIAYRVARQGAKEAFDKVWQREMYTACYEPRWVTAKVDGRSVDAVSFIARRGHVQHAEGLAPDTVAFHIAHAHGRRGACRDYLADTLRNLEALGVGDRRLKQLLHRVDVLRAGKKAVHA